MLICTIALIIFGTYSYQHGRGENAQCGISHRCRQNSMDGASPAIMDNDVTDVLEARINTIEGNEEYELQQL